MTMIKILQILQEECVNGWAVTAVADPAPQWAAFRLELSQACFAAIVSRCPGGTRGEENVFKSVG